MPVITGDFELTFCLFSATPLFGMKMAQAGVGQSFWMWTKHFSSFISSLSDVHKNSAGFLDVHLLSDPRGRHSPGYRAGRGPCTACDPTLLCVAPHGSQRELPPASALGPWRRSLTPGPAPDPVRCRQEQRCSWAARVVVDAAGRAELAGGPGSCLRSMGPVSGHPCLSHQSMATSQRRQRNGHWRLCTYSPRRSGVLLPVAQPGRLRTDGLHNGDAGRLRSARP